MTHVIIGSGLAALSLALTIDSKHKVIIITKGNLGESNSRLAQGGIAATLSSSTREINDHVADTIIAGMQTNDQNITQQIIEKSQCAIDFLIQMGVEFDRVGNQVHLTREGGHLKRRILHVGGDQTGKLIIEALINKVKTLPNIEVIENAQALEFKENKLLYLKGQKIYQIIANDYVIASGGASRNFSCSTASITNTGDFITLAKSAGLELENLHLMQFHPTAFKHQDQVFLISEALRGEGAYLVDEDNQRIMHGVHKLLELAPRDIVARHIYEYQRNNKQVYIDARHLEDELLNERFVQINKHLFKCGYHLKHDLIPICPAAHYQIGGIKANIYGETNVDNIYAIGECAHTGFHGSNRLASNSLLECVVMAINLGEVLNRKQNVADTYEEDLIRDEENYTPVMFDLTKYFDHNLAIIRADNVLTNQLKELKKIAQVIEGNKVLNRKWYQDYNQIQLAILMSEDAIKHENSGCHFKKENNG